MPTLPAPPVSTTNKETPRPRVGPLTVPESRSGGELGAAGASGPVSEVEHPPPQRCPRTSIRPHSPVTASSASQPRLHPAACAPTLRPGAAPAPQGLSLYGRHGHCRGPTKPLVFVLSFRPPPRGGGARDSPRKDPPLPRQTSKKSPAPHQCPQPVL